MTLDHILSRIAENAGVEPKDSELGKVLGKARSTVSSWRQRGSIPYAEVFEYCAKNGVSLDAIFLGERTESGVLPVDAVSQVITAINGRKIEPAKLNQLLAMVVSRWPMPSNELKALIDLAI